jgi:hypothetical protein
VLVSFLPTPASTKLETSGEKARLRSEDVFASPERQLTAHR